MHGMLLPSLKPTEAKGSQDMFYVQLKHSNLASQPRKIKNEP